MKTISSFLLIFCFMLSSFIAAAGGNKTIQFKVTGNCNLCKKTIESSLRNEKGIEEGTWNQKTKIMKVTFDPGKISEEEIHAKIAASGYDTEKKKADEKAYSKLHQCCQYERSLHVK